jgi:hypothetical protein
MSGYQPKSNLHSKGRLSPQITPYSPSFIPAPIITANHPDAAQVACYTDTCANTKLYGPDLLTLYMAVIPKPVQDVQGA